MGNLRGIILMSVSMAGFAIEDMFIKLTAATLPTGQILLFLGVSGTVFFIALGRARGAPGLWSAAALHPAVALRNLGELLGTAGFVTAIALAPLTTATAVFQALPLAVTLGAALFLGERVGWRRWGAIAVGFAGMLVVIRPGLSGFAPTALWAVLGVAGLALRDVATRRIPATIHTLQLAGWGLIAVAILGAGMLAFSGGAIWPDARSATYLAGAMVAGFLSYWALTEASRLGEVGAVTPFRYLRLLFALILGAAVFGERPDALTHAGAALIIASGLYTIARERRLRRLSMQPAAG